MTDQELRDRLDYKVGDIVQIRKGKHAGKLGKIVQINAHKKVDELMYSVFADGELICYLSATQIRFINHSENA